MANTILPYVVSFVTTKNNSDSYKLGQKVVVIGAGNAAMDVARTAIRKGSGDVTCYSITKKITASEHEFSYAELKA